MFRKNREARTSLAALLGSPTTPTGDNLEIHRSGRWILYVVIILIALVLCTQVSNDGIVSAFLNLNSKLFSISVISSSSGIGMFFRRAQAPWAIVVIACNRPWYLEPVLKQLFSLPTYDLSAVSIYLSQDGFNKGVEEVAARFHHQLTHWQRSSPNHGQRVCWRIIVENILTELRPLQQAYLSIINGPSINYFSKRISAMSLSLKTIFWFQMIFFHISGMRLKYLTKMEGQIESSLDNCSLPLQ